MVAISARTCFTLTPPAILPNTMKSRDSRFSEFAVWNQGHPEILVEGKDESSRHDADYRGRSAIDSNRPANQGGVLAIAALPKAISQDRNWRRTGGLVGRREIPPNWLASGQSV